MKSISVSDFYFHKIVIEHLMRARRTYLGFQLRLEYLTKRSLTSILFVILNSIYVCVCFLSSIVEAERLFDSMNDMTFICNVMNRKKERKKCGFIIAGYHHHNKFWWVFILFSIQNHMNSHTNISIYHKYGRIESSWGWNAMINRWREKLDEWVNDNRSSIFMMWDVIPGTAVAIVAAVDDDDYDDDLRTKVKTICIDCSQWLLGGGQNG